MSVRAKKSSKSSRIQSQAVNRTKAALQDLPEKAAGLISLQEAIHQLRAPLKAALNKGYSYQELAAMLQQQGISISRSTLRSYLALDKQQNSRNSRSGKAESRKMEEISEITSNVAEILVPSRIDISASSGDRSFWNAYQASLRDREEVYRCLAES